MGNLLEVRDLNITLKKGKTRTAAVEHVSFGLERGKTLGIIGESGSGKSLSCMGIQGLLDSKLWDVQGSVFLDGEELQIRNRRYMSGLCGSRIAMIMQNPMSAFNPVITIGKHFHETINKSSAEKKTKAQITEMAEALFGRMRIREPKAVLNSYAFQLSGGMLQRIMIALALAVEPELLIADEPTTALDLSVQHEIIKILQELQENDKMSILIVSHDLGVIGHLADSIAVMYAGNLIEKGEARQVLSHPKHPYTKSLFRSRPAFSKERLVVMEGQPPALGERFEGCNFYPRCKEKWGKCLEYQVSACSLDQGHEVKCLKYM